VRFVGQKAKVKVRESVDGQKVVVGVIEPSSEVGTVSVREGSRLRVIRLDDVLSARLVFEFGPPPKPGKAPKSGKAGKSGGTGKTGAAGKQRTAPEHPEETSKS